MIMSSAVNRKKNPKRVGDITGEPPENVAIDTKKAILIARILEGLEFPATRREIDHVKERHLNGSIKQEVTNQLKNNLQDNKRYNDAYDVTRTAGLIKQVYSKKRAYVRDKALDNANQERLGTKPRPRPPE